MTSELSALNDEFYSTNPADYFRDRLHLLALRAVNSDYIADGMGDELVWGRIRFRSVEVVDSDREGIRAAQTDRFVATESQILFHHVTETLLRLFLGHVGQPECPWLEVSSLLSHDKFKKRAAKLAQSFWSDDMTTAVEEIFIGDAFSADVDPELVLVRDSTIRLLRLLSNRLLDDAHLYNSSKHGFTALGGRTVVTASFGAVTAAAAPATLSTQGHSATFLEKDEGTTDWFRTTRFVNPQQAALFIDMALGLMDSLWTIARCRYVGAPQPQQLTLIDDVAIDATLQMNDAGPITRLRRRIV